VEDVEDHFSGLLSDVLPLIAAISLAKETLGFIDDTFILVHFIVAS
jgi:hypothetical protein